MIKALGNLPEKSQPPIFNSSQENQLDPSLKIHRKTENTERLLSFAINKNSPFVKIMEEKLLNLKTSQVCNISKRFKLYC